MFEVGKKVVCIKDDWRPKLFVPDKMPVKGEMYHVEELVPVDGYGLCLRLTELNQTQTVWRSENFRPVDYSFGEEVERSIILDLKGSKKKSFKSQKVEL